MSLKMYNIFPVYIESWRNYSITVGKSVGFNYRMEVLNGRRNAQRINGVDLSLT
jgi:hypothetical protein